LPYFSKALAEAFEKVGRSFRIPSYLHKKQKAQKGLFIFYGGEQGIRTLERVAPLHAFQACAFNHSANSPLNK
jgi:hypothetical protein